MSRLFTSGLESGAAQAEGLTATGTVAFDTVVFRGAGLSSLKATATASYVTRTFTTTLGRTYRFRKYYRFPTNPTGLHRFFQVLAGASTVMLLELNHVGRLIKVLDSAGALVATGTTALTAGQWYCIEVAVNVPAAGNGTVTVRVDGVDEPNLTGLSFALGNTAIGSCRWGVVGGNIGGLAQVNFDDLAINDDQGANQNSYPGPCTGIVYLRPAADPGTGTAATNWTKPAGATTNRHTSMDNIPPTYQADSTVVGDAEKMLRNPTNALSQLELDLTDYTAAGVPAGDTIALVQAVVGLGSTSATDTTGNLTVVSNPAQGANDAIATFDNGIASATVTTWPTFFGSVIYTPTPTRGTKPRVRLERAAANRTVDTNYMALIVETVAASAPAASGTSSVRGGGTVATTSSKGASGTSSARGGGGLTAITSKGATAASTARGGGSVSTVGAKDTAPARSGSSSVSGGGRVTSSAAKAGAAASTVRGGGSLTASARKGALATSSVRGGGGSVGVGREGALRSSAISGGGSITSSTRKNAAGTSSARGGGAITTVGTQLVARSGTSSVRGGGGVSSATRKATAASSTVRGGGALSATARGGRAGTSSVTAGGSVTSLGKAARSATSSVHGGGFVTTTVIAGQPAGPPVTWKTGAGNGSGATASSTRPGITRTSTGSGVTLSGVQSGRTRRGRV